MQYPSRAKRDQKILGNLSKEEKLILDKLYVEEGAWTPREAAKRLGVKRLKDLMAKKLVGRLDTEAGPLVILLKQGRFELYGTADKSVSFWSQLDRGYFRLALDELGWRRASSSESLQLTQYDRSKMFTEVITPSGNALAFGRLQGGGITTQSVQRTVERLRSQALHHNFMVYLLTPSESKGKKRAERYGSFLHVLTVNPVEEEFAHVKRIKTTTPSKGSPESGPVIVPSTAHKALQKNLTYLPATSLETLSLPLAERKERALAALECDQVLSDAQLAKHFGISIHDLGKIPYVRTIVRPIQGAYSREEEVEFACISRTIAKLDDFKLGHRAGTAEIRLGLEVPPGPHWKTEARGALRYEEPDAVWETSTGTVAVEYDTGAYGMQVIRRKLDAFQDRGFERVIWGLNSENRAKNLSKKLGDRAPEFVPAPWWLTE